MILDRVLRADDFKIPAPPGRSQVSAYVLKPRYFSRDLGPITTTLQVKDGVVQRDLARGITKFAIIERYGRGGSIGTSFWEMGFDRGAIAWTVNHDHHKPGGGGGQMTKTWPLPPIEPRKFKEALSLP